MDITLVKIMPHFHSDARLPRKKEKENEKKRRKKNTKNKNERKSKKVEGEEQA